MWVTCHADVVAVQQELRELDLGASVVTEVKLVYGTKGFLINFARSGQRARTCAGAP